ncbi:FMN-binding protein [Asanoa sp. WMMD1127]|uniref:FMN-binding protein n=1 Tax=Asanoa sp. WMMD1127 TaxID=3016107 RepID=UPI002417D6D6|nr:FMN-binding protein [Asanoa sp. WMMD1127]MDG4827278.1 FMN-binding protein [Asanoa sp. WMMD1127]
MRRAVLAVAGLAAGTSLLVVAKGGSDAAPASVAAANAGPTPSASGSAPATPPASAAPDKPAAKSPTPSGGKKSTTKPKSGGGDTAAAPPPAAPKSNKVVGPRVENPYGAVQVVIDLSGNRIERVRTLEMPDLEARSDQLSALVESQLGEEAVREQGADLDTVSGATETSESYRESLRVAIERMKKGERD